MMKIRRDETLFLGVLTPRMSPDCRNTLHYKLNFENKDGTYPDPENFITYLQVFFEICNLSI